MKVVAFVPAKGSSERVPSKNMRVLDGEHLFKRKLKQLLACKRIDEVWLDTDSDAMISLVADLPVKILRRDPMLASNRRDGHEMFANECRYVPDADIVIQALCTAPFITEDTVSKVLDMLLAESRYDSLVAARGQKFYSWTDGKPDYGYDRVPNSVDLPKTMAESMSLYMVKATAETFPHKRFGNSTLLFEVSRTEVGCIANFCRALKRLAFGHNYAASTANC